MDKEKINKVKECYDALNDVRDVLDSINDGNKQLTNISECLKAVHDEFMEFFKPRVHD